MSYTNHVPTREQRKAVVSWSSGKDSAYALHEVQREGSFDIVGVLTTITAEYDRVSMHGVREALLDQQANALGLRCHKIYIPAACANEIYERKLSAALADLQRDGVDHVIFGDLFLGDLRAYREARLADIGMTGVFPLWMRPTRELAEQMIAAGIRATITCVDPRVLDESFAGRSFDNELLTDLPDGVDPCGENGEFHSVVTAGPMFRAPITTRVGDIVSRGGFVFADVLPTQAG